MSWLGDWMARWRSAAFEKPAREVELLHWSALHDGLPYCGARQTGVTPWTIEPEAATCPKCREMCAPLVLQYRASNR